jgi:hypothetical protein
LIGDRHDLLRVLVVILEIRRERNHVALRGDARAAAATLNELSTPLAARRMDDAVRKALAGRQLADFL